MTADESQTGPGDARSTKRGKTIRFWIATALTILLVIAVWKFIDYRMQPPLPPNPVAPVAP